ncbi:MULTISPECIES: hypothetical protein [unclassified Lysobacter]|uniref:hypothetical protein n=1 Tax=unclassified Lysobacter TaxID=2635362 RepID=UPI0020B34E71|nr:hypothetical protein [Lysobacter sp. MMG2]
MQRKRSIALSGLVAVLACLASGMACAQQAPEVVVQPVIEVTPAVIDATPQDAVFGSAVDPGALADMRGGAEIVDNDILVNGRVEDAIAVDVLSGSNSVAGSFDSASGINTVIQNTGANVLIQNAMIVNVKFAEAGP